MQSKITWAILFSILFLAIVIVSVGYLRSSDNQKTLSSQEQGDKYFLDFVAQKKKLPQASEEVSLVAVGDIMLSRTVASKIKAHNDINYPFLKVADFLKEADITFGNLENPITAGATIAPYELTLRADPGVENALKNVGFDILSLANNHTSNLGIQGLADTFAYLSKAGIGYVGGGRDATEANRPVYITRKGSTFAFLAYNDTDVVPAYYEASDTRAGTAFMRSEKMVEAVKEAKQKANFVIVSMHAGNEYTDKPNDSQISFARKAIDAGAELVIGSHPHVIQPIEKYNGKYILYSLGNFIFDQNQSDEVKQGLAVEIFFDENSVRKIYFYLVLIRDFSQPEFLEGSEAAQVLSRLRYPLSENSVFGWDKTAQQFNKIGRSVIYNNKPNQSNVAKSEMADLDKDTEQEEYVLEKGLLKIVQGNKIIWESPREWWIDDFVLADSNNDDITDVNLSVWKSGDYGSSKPFWVKENDMSIKNHFFVFDFAGGVMKPIWQSSNLDAPNCEFKITDIDDDGKNDLVVIEGDYSQKPICTGNHVAVWKWNDWGFSNEWRSGNGKFRNLEIEHIGNKVRMVVDGF